MKWKGVETPQWLDRKEMQNYPDILREFRRLQTHIYTKRYLEKKKLEQKMIANGEIVPPRKISYLHSSEDEEDDPISSFSNLNEERIEEKKDNQSVSSFNVEEVPRLESKSQEVLSDFSESESSQLILEFERKIPPVNPALVRPLYPNPNENRPIWISSSNLNPKNNSKFGLVFPIGQQLKKTTSISSHVVINEEIYFQISGDHSEDSDESTFHSFDMLYETHPSLLLKYLNKFLILD